MQYSEILVTETDGEKKLSYTLQNAKLTEILAILELEETPDNQGKIIELLQEMQELGELPSEILSNTNSDVSKLNNECCIQ